MEFLDLAPPDQGKAFLGRGRSVAAVPEVGELIPGDRLPLGPGKSWANRCETKLDGLLVAGDGLAHAATFNEADPQFSMGTG